MLIDNAKLWDAPGTMHAPATASALNASARELRARAKALKAEPFTYSRITSREEEEQAKHEAMRFMLDFKAACPDRTPGVGETLRAARDARVGPEWCVRAARLSVFKLPDTPEEP